MHLTDQTAGRTVRTYPADARSSDRVCIDARAHGLWEVVTCCTHPRPDTLPRSATVAGSARRPSLGHCDGDARCIARLHHVRTCREPGFASEESAVGVVHPGEDRHAA